MRIPVGPTRVARALALVDGGREGGSWTASSAAHFRSGRALDRRYLESKAPLLMMLAVDVIQALSLSDGGREKGRSSIPSLVLIFGHDSPVIFFNKIYERSPPDLDAETYI